MEKNAPEPTLLEDKTRLGLIVEPLDTLFFRDGRPFAEADRGHSGLPTPQTLAGMVKTHLMRRAESREMHGLRENGPEDKKWIARVAVRGPWLARLDGAAAVADLYFPSPAHLVKIEKKGVPDEAKILLPLKESLPGWVSPSAATFPEIRPLVLKGEIEGKRKALDGFLTLKGMAKVLEGRPPVLPKPDEDKTQRDREWIDKKRDWIDGKELYAYESRVGVSIDPASLAAAEGKIYSTSMLRLRDDSAGPRIVFYAEVGWEQTPESDWEALLDAAFPENEAVVLALGGEGRRVLVRRAAKPAAWPRCAAIPNNDDGGLTMILIAPVIFYPNGQGGPRPPWKPGDCGLLTGAAVPKPLSVSGWNLAGTKESGHRAHPRPTRHAVPAGAVYFWRHGTNSGHAPAWWGWGSPLLQLAERPAERAAGWGMALRGVWRWAA